MRKIALAMVVALGLGGCASLQTGVDLATFSTANPITPAREAQIEAAIDVGAQAMLAYRRACIAKTADVNCRQNLELARPYIRQLKKLVVQLRVFTDTNDQVNAAVILQQIVPLYNNMKSIAAVAGVNIGNLP